MIDQVQDLVVLTVAYHSQESLVELSSHLHRQTCQPEKWLVVNNSPESAGALKLIAKCPILTIEGQEGDGFSQGCNRGLVALQNEQWSGWVWILNPDITFLDCKTIEKLKLKLAGIPSTALLGTAVEDQNGELEKSAGWLDEGFAFRSRFIGPDVITAPREGVVSVNWLSGCSLLMRPSAHKDQPRFETSLPLYYEDMDLCIRLARQGIPIFWLADIRVIHQRGFGTSGALHRRLRLSSCSYIRFLQRHRPGWVLILRSLRLIFKALLKIPFCPGQSFAVLRGFLEALREPLQ